MTIATFTLAAMLSLAPGRDHTVLASAIAARVDTEAPLFADDADKRKTSAWLVAIAFRESSLKLDAVGDHGQSYCAFQIHRTSGGSATMLTDANACVSAAFRMLRTSMHVCPAFPLAWYAHGGASTTACASGRAQRISRDRLNLSKWLVAHVVTKEDS